LHFAFRFVVSGHTRGFFASRGSVTPYGLKLAGQLFPFATVKSAALRDHRFVIGFVADATLASLTAYGSEGNYLVIELVDADPRELKRRLDGAISTREAALHRDALEAAGTADLFRSADCPTCSATVDLSELPATPYVYCPYCTTIFRDDAVVTDGESYRICSACELFGHVRAHVEFYCYTYLVRSAWSRRQRRLCADCASRTFRSMFVLNAPFLVGIPAALLTFVRCFLGRDPRLKRLTRANRLLQRGRVEDAVALYEAMSTDFPSHPGLLFNEAVGRLKAEQPRAALDVLQRSLEACANYEPSHDMFRRIEHVVDGTLDADS